MGVIVTVLVLGGLGLGAWRLWKLLAAHPDATKSVGGAVWRWLKK